MGRVQVWGGARKGGRVKPGEGGMVVAGRRWKRSMDHLDPVKAWFQVLLGRIYFGFVLSPRTYQLVHRLVFTPKAMPSGFSVKSPTCPTSPCKLAGLIFSKGVPSSIRQMWKSSAPGSPIPLSPELLGTPSWAFAGHGSAEDRRGVFMWELRPSLSDPLLFRILP